MHDRQNLVAEPDDSINVRKIIHHAGEDDRCGALCNTLRTEVVEVYSIADETDGHPRDQALEIALFGCRADQRVGESESNVTFVREETPLFDRIDPAQRHPRPLRILPPSRRVELGKLHDPRHLREMLGILRDIAAIDHDQIGLQLGKFLSDDIVQLRFVERCHRKRASHE